MSGGYFAGFFLLRTRTAKFGEKNSRTCMIDIHLLGSDLVGKARQCVRLSSSNGSSSLKKVSCGSGNEDLSIEWRLVASKA